MHIFIQTVTFGTWCIHFRPIYIFILRKYIAFEWSLSRIGGGSLILPQRRLGAIPLPTRNTFATTFSVTGFILSTKIWTELKKARRSIMPHLTYRRFTAVWKWKFLLYLPRKLQFDYGWLPRKWSTITSFLNKIHELNGMACSLLIGTYSSITYDE